MSINIDLNFKYLFLHTFLFLIVELDIYILSIQNSWIACYTVALEKTIFENNILFFN